MRPIRALLPAALALSLTLVACSDEKAAGPDSLRGPEPAGPGLAFSKVPARAGAGVAPAVPGVRVARAAPASGKSLSHPVKRVSSRGRAGAAPHRAGARRARSARLAGPLLRRRLPRKERRQGGGRWTASERSAGWASSRRG